MTRPGIIKVRKYFFKNTDKHLKEIQNELYGGVIVEKIGLGKPSSNPGWRCLHLIFIQINISISNYSV